MKFELENREQAEVYLRRWSRYLYTTKYHIVSYADAILSKLHAEYSEKWGVNSEHQKIVDSFTPEQVLAIGSKPFDAALGVGGGYHRRVGLKLFYERTCIDEHYGMSFIKHPETNTWIPSYLLRCNANPNTPYRIRERDKKNMERHKRSVVNIFDI